jgi:Mg2+ and Co2+ transporter CorA
VVSLERQSIVATLIDDLAGDLALAIERIDGHDAALQRQHLQKPGNRRDLVRLGVGRDLAEHQALLAAPGADHVQRRLGARRVERPAQHLAVDRDDALAGFRKARHEVLKATAKLVRLQRAEHSAERVVRGQAILQNKEFPKERLLLLGKIRHLHAALTAAQNRAERDHQQFLKIMPPGVAGARILHPRKATPKPVHPVHRKPLTSSPAESDSCPSARKFRLRFPWDFGL